MSTPRNSDRTASRGHRLARVVSALGIAGLLAACADTPAAPAVPAAPAAAPQLELAGATPAAPVAVQGLLRTTPLAQTVVVTKTLSSGGGGISVPGTDFQLQVPNGAFAGKSLTFTITAYAGNVVAYDFQPHGYRFLKPLKAVQQLGHTNWKSYDLPAGYYATNQGVYFADASQVDFTTGQALATEFMPSAFNVGGATMTWDLPHFSGYMVAWGRQ